MTADPKLGEAIGASLQLVLTLHESSKARRAAARRWCYKHIYKIFCEHSDRSGKWRWKLEKLAARYSLPIAVQLNTGTVDPDLPMLAHLADSLDQAQAIRQSFIEGYELAKELEIKPAKRRFGKLIDQSEELITELEAYARQATEQGAGNWLAEMM
jgi:hypothetical protein